MEIDYSRQYQHWHNGSLEHAESQAVGYYKYLKFLSLFKDSSILDIGCGMGFFLLAARNLGFNNVQGIDSSSQQIAVAKKHGLPAELVDDVPNYLSQKKECFDAIFMFDVLEHIPVEDQIGALLSIRAALKTGGVLFVRVPNANSSFAARYRWVDWTHHCSFSEHSLDFILFNAGFRNITIKENHFGKFPLWFPRPSFQGGLRSFYFGLRRLQAIAEFGYEEGSKIPLTVNIVGCAYK
jgi:SAM-dependent methyltransferase